MYYEICDQDTPCVASYCIHYTVVYTIAFYDPGAPFVHRITCARELLSVRFPASKFNNLGLKLPLLVAQKVTNKCY